MPGRKIRLGDILWVDRGLYHHCGIYEGEGRVIHFAAPEGSEISAEDAVIHRTTFEHFKDGGPVKVIDIAEGFTPEETVSRARSRLGERGYDFASNNCDHFAIWCKTGKHRSLQVDGVKAILKAIGTVSKKRDKQNGDLVNSVIEVICHAHDVTEHFRQPVLDNGIVRKSIKN